jgi:peptidoglycan/xylan/chitin deacetylase (PgdA/CDA1 family)
MFHHFHGHGHLPAPGSLDAIEFSAMLSWLGSEFNLLGAREFKLRFLNQQLEERDVCLSFDDGLKCQIDVALPELDKRGLDAFFFVYSSAFSDSPDYLEIYRLFRTSAYNTVDDFYLEFFAYVKSMDPEAYALHHAHYAKLSYLSGFQFYSESDKWFRYLRDQHLGREKYRDAMTTLMNQKSFSTDDAKSQLWMTEEDLRLLSERGHTVGLHSNTHPTQMSSLDVEEQKLEYKRNKLHLQSLTGRVPTTMSHPCGDYNSDTLRVLRDLGIELGFRSSMIVREIRSSLEVPREDHANVWKEMNA